MKRSVIKGAVFGIVFFIALIVFGVITNRGNLDMTATMEEATLPYIYMNVADREVNCLYGYCNPLSTSYVQDCITPLTNERSVGLSIVENGDKVERIAYELRSIDGSRLIESQELSDWERKENIIKTSIKLKDLLESNTEYMLVLIMETEDRVAVYYYSKVVLCDNEAIAASMEFVQDFHTKSFDKDKALDIKKYLESSQSADNSDFNHVDIHSSFEQVTWGDLEPREETMPILNILEINNAISSYELSYVVSNTENEVVNYYRVNEYFRVRHTAARMYLLDYERSMEKMFEPKKENFDSTKIILGIGDANLDLAESDDGKNLAFVTADRLYAFHITDSQIDLLYGFYDVQDLKVADLHNEHDIKILNIDEIGNVTFMVYGYMNRGIHEGNVGITVYTYNSLTSVVSEQVYIPYEKSFQILKNDIQKLSYINKNNKLYLSLEKAIYEINITEKAYTVLATEKETGEYQISDSGRMVVWQDSLENEYSAKKLYLMDLSSEEIMQIDAGKNEYIKALGFIGEDLVYGLADKSEIFLDDNDEVQFYMKTLYIQNETGYILKKYEQEGIYVSGSDIQDDMIHLSRVEKSVGEEKTVYKAISDDQIVSAKDNTGSKNYVETGYSNLYKTFVRIVINGKITPKNVRYVRPELEIYEGDKSLTMEFEENNDNFYVYNAKGLQAVFDKEAKAIQYAVETNAWVINDYGAYVWKNVTRSNRNQIMAIKAQASSEEKNSLSVCIDTILAYEGIMRSSAFLLEQGDTVLQILEENLENVQVLELTECSLDTVLYYVNKDIPVLARLGARKAVLVTGFNDSEVVLMDPDTNTLSKIKKKQAEVLFEEAGNHFITYIPVN